MAAADLTFHNGDVQLAVQQIPLNHIRIIHCGNNLDSGVGLMIGNTDITENGCSRGDTCAHPDHFHPAILLHRLVHLLNEVQNSTGVLIQSLSIRQQNQRFVPAFKQFNMVVLLNLRNRLADSGLGNKQFI